MTDRPIHFGTDGWRGIIAEDFTFDNVRVCAQAVADYVKEMGLKDMLPMKVHDMEYKFVSGEAHRARFVELTGLESVSALCCRRALNIRKKYKDIMGTIEDMQGKIEQLKNALDRISQIKTKEAEIVAGWNALLREVQEKAAEVDSKLDTTEEL